MPQLVVTPLSRLDEAIRTHQPSHLITLLSPGHMIQTPEGFAPESHLRLGVNDITDPAAGTAPPAADHIAALLDFARGWDGRQPLLLHCWAGISRSMASAFIILCDRMGRDHEIEIARAMRRRAPHAAPNRLLVEHGDAALGRQGRMMAALNAMGPAVTMEEGVTTRFPLTGL